MSENIVLAPYLVRLRALQRETKCGCSIDLSIFAHKHTADIKAAWAVWDGKTYHEGVTLEAALSAAELANGLASAEVLRSLDLSGGCALCAELRLKGASACPECAMGAAEARIER